MTTAMVFFFPAGIVDIASTSNSNRATYDDGDSFVMSAGSVDIAPALYSNLATYDDGDGFVLSTGIATAGACDF